MTTSDVVFKNNLSSNLLYKKPKNKMRKLFSPLLFLGVKLISHVKGTALIADVIGQYPLYFATYIQNRKVV